MVALALQVVRVDVIEHALVAVEGVVVEIVLETVLALVEDDVRLHVLVVVLEVLYM